MDTGTEITKNIKRLDHGNSAVLSAATWLVAGSFQLRLHQTWKDCSRHVRTTSLSRATCLALVVGKNW